LNKLAFDGAKEQCKWNDGIHVPSVCTLFGGIWEGNISKENQDYFGQSGL
jgi:hypothetical protein